MTMITSGSGTFFASRFEPLLSNSEKILARAGSDEGMESEQQPENSAQLSERVMQHRRTRRYIEFDVNTNVFCRENKHKQLFIIRFKSIGKDGKIDFDKIFPGKPTKEEFLEELEKLNEKEFQTLLKKDFRGFPKGELQELIQKLVRGLIQDLIQKLIEGWLSQDLSQKSLQELSQRLSEEKFQELLQRVGKGNFQGLCRGLNRKDVQRIILELSKEKDFQISSRGLNQGLHNVLRKRRFHWLLQRMGQGLSKEDFQNLLREMSKEKFRKLIWNCNYWVKEEQIPFKDPRLIARPRIK